MQIRKKTNYKAMRTNSEPWDIFRIEIRIRSTGFSLKMRNNDRGTQKQSQEIFGYLIEKILH